MSKSTLKSGYRALNVISLTVPTTKKFVELSQSVKDFEEANGTTPTSEQYVNNFIVTYYDTMILYLANVFLLVPL